MVKIKQQAIKKLAAIFHRNGYIRRFNPKRRAKEKRKYKKGDEVRLVADTYDELRAIRRLLREAGFAPGRPFRKGKQWRQPVYGRETVARFLELVGE